MPLTKQDSLNGDSVHADSVAAAVRAGATGAAPKSPARSRSVKRGEDSRVRARTLAKQQQAAERIASSTAELTRGVAEATEAARQLESSVQEIASGAEESSSGCQESLSAVNAITDRIAQRLGLLEILWSVDSGDSVGANWALIIREVEAELKPGMIILFHENRGQTIRALTTLLPDLRRAHLRSVSVPELLATDPPSLRQLREGINGCDTGGKQLQLPIPGLGPAAGSGG